MWGGTRVVVTCQNSLNAVLACEIFFAKCVCGCVWSTTCEWLLEAQSARLVDAVHRRQFRQSFRALDFAVLDARIFGRLGGKSPFVIVKR